jgi:bacterioferritin
MASQPRARAYDVPAVIDVLNEILKMELATVVYYTHYSFMVYGHARIPVVDWMRSQATESLTHAQGAGDMILRLEGKPEMGIASLPSTHHHTIDEILQEAVAREADGVNLYRKLHAMIKDKSIVLEEYASRMVAAESLHVSEMRMMLRKSTPKG